MKLNLVWVPLSRLSSSTSSFLRQAFLKVMLTSYLVLHLLHCDFFTCFQRNCSWQRCSNLSSFHYFSLTSTHSVSNWNNLLIEASLVLLILFPYTTLSLFLVTEWCPTVCDPMNCSTTGFPVLNYLPEFAQTHVHSVIDAIQPSHPLSSPSLLALNLYQSLFQWVGSSHQVAKVLGL